MRFEIYRDGSQYRWRLRAVNHEIIAQGESYWNKADCENAIKLVKGSATAPTVQL